MEDKREQFENLSRELLGRLSDTNRQSELFFPFEYILPPEIEEKYFPKGSILRGIMIKNMVIIDNSFKKFKIFPTHDVAVTYIETQKELLQGWINESVKSFQKTYTNIDTKEFEEFKKILSKIENDINKASMPVIKQVCNSIEAMKLNSEFSETGQTSFSEIIHNAISNLFNK